MRGRYNIRQNRLIKGYLRDMLYQYHGANMGYDEGLISGSDAVLAAAVWRNLFGAGWGRMGGVTGKLNEDGKEITTTSSPLEKDASIKQKNKEEKMSFEEAIAELDPGSAPPPPSASGAPSAPPGVKIGNQAGGYHSGGSGLITPLPLNEPAELRGVIAKEARFAINLERLVKWIRREVRRMENVPDQLIMTGYGMDSQKGRSLPGSLTDFSRI